MILPACLFLWILEVANIMLTWLQGRIQDSQKGAQIHCSEHDNCVRSTQSGM